MIVMTTPTIEGKGIKEYQGVISPSGSCFR